MIEVDGLSIAAGGTPLVEDISFRAAKGERLGIVGESGSGKSLTALAMIGLLPEALARSGWIRLGGEDLTSLDEDRMNDLRGSRIAMVFQEPMSALNPLMTIGQQVAEGIRLHTRSARADALENARTMLDRVGLEDISLHRYPHELSGGQRQRVVIAIACAMEPDVLIADEPTTALDATLQDQILDLLDELVRERTMTLVLISHDLTVIARHCDRALVMRNGRVVERGDVRELLGNPKENYTKALATAASYRPERRPPLPSAPVVLSAHAIRKTYPLPRRSLFGPRPRVTALEGVDIELREGRATGLVGESGCGKSTLARILLGLDDRNAGNIELDGTALHFDDPARDPRRDIQIVFQDPYGSFDPRHRVGRIVAEPLHLMPELDAHARRERVTQALEEVGLPADAAERFPHAFSGGQRQRIAIARALVVRPRILVADEPVSALDVTIRAQILDLFAGLQAKLGLTSLFITHDLSMVRAVCDDVAVMRAGRIVERGEVDDVFARPSHPYTAQLLAASPNLDQVLKGTLA